VAIARTAGINLTWLATGAGPKERSGMEDTPLLEGFVALEELSEARGTGPLSATEIAFSQAWVARHAAESAAELAGLPMPDDSMAPLLPEGAALVVDRGSATVSRDGVHVLRLDGVLTVRRLQRLPGGELEATPANPAYQSFRIQRDAPGVSVIGRVIWAGHDF
jgi:SOS-response transcriptional repressor LexA